MIRIVDDFKGNSEYANASLDVETFTTAESEQHVSLDSIGKETVGAIFHSLRVMFTHPVNLFGELLLFITCALAFSFAPELNEKYGVAPKNIIIVTLFVITGIVAIRLFYVSNINTMLEYIIEHRWKTLWIILWAILKLILVALVISVIFLLHHFLPDFSLYMKSLFT